MAATVKTAATALQTALATVSGLRVASYLPDTITPPQAVVTIGSVQFHGSFGPAGDAPFAFVVTVFVGRMSDRSGQDALYAYMAPTGSTSIKAAVESDPTLGGVVSYATVVSAQNIQAVEVDAAVYLAVDFTVAVHP